MTLYDKVGKPLPPRQQEMFTEELPPVDSKVVVGMLVLNEEEYIEAALESVMDDADSIVLVVGGVELARDVGMCGDDGAPTDGTMRIVDRLMASREYRGKLNVIGPRLWPSKMEMRNTVLKAAELGDVVVMQDADEVLFEGALKAALPILSELPEGAALSPPRLDFWNDFATLGAGPPWEDCVESRVYRNIRDREYANHCSLNVVGPLVRLPFALWTHYAYVKPLPKLRRKVDYYRNHTPLPGAPERSVDPRYIEDVFLRWRKDPQAVEAGPGTHIFGGGTTRPFEGAHPEPMRVRMGAGALPKWRWEI